MKQILIRDVLRPLARRLGTTLAGMILGLMAVAPPETDVQNLANALVMLMLLGVDLAFSWWDRRQ